MAQWSSRATELGSSTAGVLMFEWLQSPYMLLPDHNVTFVHEGGGATEKCVWEKRVAVE